MDRMGKIKFVVFLLLAIGMMGASLWYAYDTASRADLVDYVGDEVWYVSASRNVLHRLGFQLHYIHNGYEGVNVIFKDDEAKLRYRDVVEGAMLRFKGNLSARVNYQKFPAVYVEIPQNNLDDFLAYLEKKIPQDDFYVVTGFRYPDAERIQNYLNTEHPFLGKDFIMLAMILGGDRPLVWRIPGIILYGLLQLLVLLTAYRITRSYIASLIALFFAAVDPLLQATAVTAMLDIYVAFFVALFVFLFVYSRDMGAGFSAGLAGATKVSGAFGYPIFFLKLVRDLALRVDWRKVARIIIVTVLIGGTIVAYAEYRAAYWEKSYFLVLLGLTVVALAEFSYSSRDAVRELAYLVTAAVFLPLLGFLIPEIPIIKVQGFDPWLRDFLGSFKWHLSYKGENPWTSPFWQWFYNANPFHFHFDPDIVANTSPTLMLFTIVAVFAVPYVWRRRGEGALIPFGVFWSTLLLFALQYAMGGKTQFSFYATALVPEATVIMGVFLYDLVKWEAFEESLLTYLLWLGRVLKVKRFVEYAESKLRKSQKIPGEVYLPSIPLPPTVRVREGVRRPKKTSIRTREGGLPRKPS
ncbi:dolichyl-phosphate-mannose--protein mannosyltransferase [Thermococcus gorgonarius]|uniref:Dolichyl-phosphate-mannose--protein mannosyltransferase n=1 Tax=Thermococcus gorgonarius TaxID=71997 RepID=A0A2Z2MAU0_THEGO|nr:dolichyl-phosphate-mannose--protein mannosyltransferase [Thermococcus gorgonarius]ASJ01044.1 dolichyl-phosphate-mannose--protein mannosyltransferase [Thermococcus gorgonarius]